MDLFLHGSEDVAFEAWARQIFRVGFVGFGALRDSRTLGAVGRCSAWGFRVLKCAKRPPQGSRHRNISPTVR